LKLPQYIYGLTKQSLNLLKNYLKEREQRVKVGGTYSEWSQLLKGVPQGSILGPVLFSHEWHAQRS
jgi:hypothetical protein